MEYKIVSSGSYIDIEFQVNELLKSGWEPHGSMGSAIFPNDDYVEFYQPMIRKPCSREIFNNQQNFLKTLTWRM